MSHTIGQAKQDAQESNSNSNQPPQDSLNPGASSSESVSRLSDADYEFLFNQLLEGIAHGWHDRRIIKFFQQLGDRGQQADWVAWFDRLRDKLLKLPIESKRQLGTMMIRFGELTQSATQVKQIGAASHNLGRELLFGDNVSVVWEYVGPDLSLNEPVETEQELSERLPSDFATLGEKLTENVELDSAVISAPLHEDKHTHDELDLEVNSNKEVNSSVSEEAEIELEDGLKNSVVDKKDTFSETLVSADELWAEDLATVQPEEDVPESAPETDLDLDLDLDLDSSDAESTREINLDLDLDLDLDLEPDNAKQITSYDEEFEFELERQSSPPKVETSSTDLELPSDNNPGVAADLQPELPISAPNDLSDILQAFGLDADSKSATENSVKDLELENQELEQKTASLHNSLALEQQSEEMPTITTSQLDDSSLEVIESWFNLGLKQVSAGEYSQAIASWDKALSINANLPEAWHNRGSALGRLGNYKAAVKSFQNALEIDPDNYQAWNDRAHALYQLQNWSEAVESWSEAIKIMPGNHLFWYNRGCSLEQLAKWADAIASYEKALEIKPDFQPGRSRYINLVADNSRPN